MSGFIKLVQQALRPPSDAPDELTAGQENPASIPAPSPSFLEVLATEAREGNLKTALATIGQGVAELASGKPLDDRKLLFEHAVALMQRLPPGSAAGKSAADGFISLLWNDLPHPAPTAVGSTGTYRSSDGSGNNINQPSVGKSGLPYARNIAPVRTKPASPPDPSLVFDLLLRECFQTNQKDRTVNNTTSYVDLSTLYGNNQAEQDRIRARNGRGSLHPDTFASARVLMQPAASSVLLVVFSRHHNLLADSMLEINEAGWYSAPGDVDSLSPDQKVKQDEDIFQKARNINVAWFASLVLADYVACILNTVRADSLWKLWHAAISAQDESWAEAKFRRDFPGQDPTTITPEQLFEVGGKNLAAIEQSEPKTWEIEGIKRGDDGKFKDDDLARILKNAVDWHAGAFGAKGSPACLKVIDVVGQLMARQWGVCTLNEFRDYLGLKKLESFEEWNPDPEVANAARQLYGHIDDLELYPGLLAEVAKPAIPGSGVCPNQTIGRGILDDAVSLVRGDRFLTHDLNTATLTSWGLANLKPAAGARGGFLPALLFKTLPDAYEFNSTYALLPFYTPAVARDILTKLKVDQDYSFVRTSGPGPVYSIKSFDACKAAFADRQTFPTVYNEMSINQMTDNRGFFIGFDTNATHDPPSNRMLTAFYGPNFDIDITNFFQTHIQKQLAKCSIAHYNGSTKQIDIVRDVCNVVPIEWIASRFGIPIKSPATPNGLLSIPELHGMLLAIFVFSSFNIIPKNGFALRDFSLKASTLLQKIIIDRINSATGFTHAVVEAIVKGTAYVNSAESNEFYRAIAKTGAPPAQLAGDCLGVMIPLAGNITQQLALLVDLYLRPEYEAEKQKLAEYSVLKTKDADEMILGYIREGMRLAPVVVGLPRTVARDCSINDGGKEVQFQQGHKIVIGIAAAHVDPTAFPDPYKIDPRRPQSSYILFGEGIHHCFGTRLTVNTILVGMKAIFSLKNLRRADGTGGNFVRYRTDIAHGLEGHMYLDAASGEGPAPVSLSILYDV